MPAKNYEIDYSIIICVYNPDERILTRCLQSVLNLDRQGISTEVIITDNNSKVPVAELAYVQPFLEAVPALSLIRVLQQGVQYARMAAIEKARGKYILYIDSDNEPSPDYLQRLNILYNNFPLVGAWGPGRISVDFIDGINQNIEAYARKAFQEKDIKGVHFSDSADWQSFYPFGTGLCTYSLLLKDYVALARAGKLTLEGRKANLLTSGEDTQMVFLCIRKGFKAGSADSLQLTHIIPGTRANSHYLNRLAYGTGICYESSRVQVFPERRKEIQKEILPAGKFSRRLLKKFFFFKFIQDPQKGFDLIQYIALEAGKYRALGKPLPFLVKQVIKSMKLE